VCALKTKSTCNNNKIAIIYFFAIENAETRQELLFRHCASESKSKIGLATTELRLHVSVSSDDFFYLFLCQNVARFRSRNMLERNDDLPDEILNEFPSSRCRFYFYCPTAY
jgi:hypothetical protein